MALEHWLFSVFCRLSLLLPVSTSSCYNVMHFHDTIYSSNSLACYSSTTPTMKDLVNYLIQLPETLFHKYKTYHLVCSFIIWFFFPCKWRTWSGEKPAKDQLSRGEQEDIAQKINGHFRLDTASLPKMQKQKTEKQDEKNLTRDCVRVV